MISKFCYGSFEKLKDYLCGGNVIIYSIGSFVDGRDWLRGGCFLMIRKIYI